MEVFGESGLFYGVLVILVFRFVVVTGVNLVICEKGGDWFREMMGVKMGGRCGSGIGLVGNCGVWIIVVGGLVVGLVVLVCLPLLFMTL